jgi:acetoin utilization deacetylase AcuC-like enzyme
MNVYYSDLHRLHAPPFEIFDGGEKIAIFEVPERAEKILTALKADARFNILPPEDFGLDPILAVHDAEYIDFLRSAFHEWQSEPTDYEKVALIPATFPPGGWRRKPKGILGRAGYYVMDLAAPITAGTYFAALASANCALSGAKNLTADHRPQAENARTLSTIHHPPSAFALCRPPGHHAGRANCGGYCYINNAAVAANWLSQRGKVALLDIDYHAGNGTQDIFYERADVLSISIHADPNYEYPYFAGYADETGAGPGAGFHRNFPLPFGADDVRYMESLTHALDLIKDFAPSSLVISAGMDIYGEDPLGRIRVTTDVIGQIGTQIAALGLPTLIVMEGGYNNDALGTNIVTFLGAFHEK